jgi:hypothetical protein
VSQLPKLQNLYETKIIHKLKGQCPLAPAGACVKTQSLVETFTPLRRL